MISKKKSSHSFGRLISGFPAVFLLVVGLCLSLTDEGIGGFQGELHEFLRMYPKLTEKEIDGIEAGKAFAKILPTEDKAEVVVFGAVYMKIPAERFVEQFRDVESLEDGKSYLTVRKYSTPPDLADMDQLTLEEDDIEDLQSCRVGKCEIQLPSSEMERFRGGIDWGADNVADQVNSLAQQMALEALLEYQQGGNRALGTYRDKDKPLNIAEAFETFLTRRDVLPVYLPEFHQFLRDYPTARLEGAEDFFYWEKVKFGLKPTIRANHAVIYRVSRGEHESDYAIAVKQLYASHYFLVALDLWFCVDDPDRGGFYLLTVKGSRQHGLTGFKGSILRKVVVGRTRDSMEKVLGHMKETFETGN